MGLNISTGEAILSEMFLLSLSKNLWRKLFPFRVDPHWEYLCVQENKKEIKIYLPCKHIPVYTFP